MKQQHPDSMAGRLKPQLGQVISNPMARAFAPQPVTEEQLVREIIRKVLKEDTYNPYSPKRVGKPKIVDYSNSKYKIIVVLDDTIKKMKHRWQPTIKNMKHRWQTIEKGDKTYYFDNGEHFATLYDNKTIKHDGTLDVTGNRTK